MRPWARWLYCVGLHGDRAAHNVEPPQASFERAFVMQSDSQAADPRLESERFAAVEKAVERRTWIVVITANVLMFVLILRSPPFPIYDEGNHLSFIGVLRTHGFSVDFLRAFPGPVGPLSTIIYDLVTRVIGFSFPFIRLFSFALLLGSAWVLSRVVSIGAWRSTGQVTPGLAGALLTTLPTAGVSAGMVLTETPAMLFVIFSLLALTWSLSSHSLGVSLFSAAVAGVALGLAILGRQSYLVTVPCLLALLVSDTQRWTQDAIRIGVLCTATLAVTAPVFLVWGGLTPPGTSSLVAGIAPWHGVLAMGYAAIIAFLLAPDIFGVAHMRKWRLIVTALLSLVAWYLTAESFTPLRSTLVALVGEGGAAIIGALFCFVIAFLAIHFLVSMALYLWDNRHDRMILFYGIAALVGLASNVKITHQFSSRYVFVFVPFLLLSVVGSLRASRHLPIRVAAGACISLLSLSSYLLLEKH